MKNISNYLMICIFLFGSVLLRSEEFSAKSDKYSATIGDRVCITLTAQSSDKIIFPMIPDSLSESYKLISKSLIDTVRSGSSVTLSQKLYITSFDSGQVIIPAFTFFTISGSATVPHYSNSVSISFASPDISAMTDILDAKSIVPELSVWTDYWHWYLAGIGAIVLALGVYRFYKKRKEVPVASDAPKFELPKMSAEEWLTQEVLALRTKELWHAGFQKLHFSSLSDAVRRYLELKYKVSAMELTTAEIETLIRDFTSPDQFDIIIELLRSADLVKFAKFVPDEAYCVRSLTMADKLLSLSNAK